MTLSVPNSMTMDGNASTSYSNDNLLNNQPHQTTDCSTSNIVVSYSVLKRAMSSSSGFLNLLLFFNYFF